MGDWNSAKYLMFKNERTQPAIYFSSKYDDLAMEGVKNLALFFNQP